jgi:predicted secreted Zn-dependent protease
MNGVLLVALLAASASQPLQVKRDVQYYDIEGRTASELRQVLNRVGPIDPKGDGKRYDGYTSWNVSWTYDYQQSQAGCALTRFDVKLDVAMKMPRWKDEAKGAPDLVAHWKRYMNSLGTHEGGHETIGRETAQSLWDRGNGMKPRPTCAALESAIKTETDAVMDAAHTRESKYDSDTDHGRTQGARFP